jgi:alkylation response protein AidB-like acyl-CoA dehydrogenase
MSFEMQPRTEIGQKFVELAEHHSEEIAARAAEHDREGSFPFEAIEAMKSTGFLTAAIPRSTAGSGCRHCTT